MGIRARFLKLTGQNSKFPLGGSKLQAMGSSGGSCHSINHEPEWSHEERLKATSQLSEQRVRESPTIVKQALGWGSADSVISPDSSGDLSLQNRGSLWTGPAVFLGKSG